MWPFSKQSAKCAICGKQDFTENMKYTRPGIVKAGGESVLWNVEACYYHEECRKEAGGVQTYPRCNGKGECKIETEETENE